MDELPKQLRTSSILMDWSAAPWDTVVCGFPVILITRIEIREPAGPLSLREFEMARDRVGAGLVSCRISSQCMRESMLLEENGFKFIEMVYQPEIELSKSKPLTIDTNLSVSRANDDDMPQVLSIAAAAFRNERFHLDHRIKPGVSDLRYQNWVSTAMYDPRQELQVIRYCGRLIAFFITELLDDGTCYWHLTALDAAAQGQNHGRRVWTAMIELARSKGCERVRSSIVARNVRVLALYVRLGFRLLPPTMTFHWIRESQQETSSR